MVKSEHEVLQIDRLIKFNSINGCIFVDPDDIGYVKADVNYSRIYFMDGRCEIVSLTLGKINAQLTSRNFLRIDRSHLINANYLFKVDISKGLCILLKSGKDLCFSPAILGLRKLRSTHYSAF